MTEIVNYGAGGSPFDALRRVDAQGENWSARDYQPLLGYDTWPKFSGAIERAMITCTNSGMITDDHFVQVVQPAGAGNLGDKARVDYRLTRYACYLVAMNGDPRKPEIAAAQTYFAVKTREAETRPSALEELDDLELATALEQYAKTLREKKAAIERAKVAERVAVELMPKAAEYDQYMDADGLCDMGALAQALGGGRTRLVKRLRQREILVSEVASQQGGVRPLQTHMNRGWFEVKMENTNVGPKYVTYVTPRGVSGIYRDLQRNGFGEINWPPLPTEAQVRERLGLGGPRGLES